MLPVVGSTASASVANHHVLFPVVQAPTDLVPGTLADHILHSTFVPRKVARNNWVASNSGRRPTTFSVPILTVSTRSTRASNTHTTRPTDSPSNKAAPPTISPALSPRNCNPA